MGVVARVDQVVDYKRCDLLAVTLLVAILSASVPSTWSSFLSSSTAVSFLNYTIPKDVWLTEIKDTIACWTKVGYWRLNESMTVTTNLTDYAPCGLFIYDLANHPCSKILDGNSTRYYWTSYGCAYNVQVFDPYVMCDVMTDRGHILMVGDSVTYHSYISWFNQYARLMQQPCAIQSSVIPECHGLNIDFIRNDYTNIDEGNYHHGHLILNSWIHDLADVGLLIMNRGAHYTGDDQLIEVVNQTVRFMKEKHPHVSIIWRNTPLGHMNYSNHVNGPPLTSPPQYAPKQIYKYDRFEHQNKLVKDLLDTYFPEVLYIDAYTPSSLRADAHQDFIHECVAGSSMDSWIDMIYSTILLVKRTAERYQKVSDSQPSSSW